MRIWLKLILGAACLLGSPQLQAQQLGLEYNTELQTNFKGDYNWVNLLRLNASVSVSDNFSLEASTISIAKTNNEPMIDDLQGYSNIEEDNMPLGIAVLGAEYRNRRSTFFLGIRNVNEDYFTSSVTSLFVNSSCGIFPTISANYDIANYPLSAWCLHYKAQWDIWSLQASLYNGMGHRRIAGHDNVFTFSPRHDGVFSITSAEYDNNDNNYSMGCALYYGVHHCDEDGGQTASTPKAKKASVTPWINIEQKIARACWLMLQASYSSSDIYCRYYFGAGTTYKFEKAQIGIFADYAKYKECYEVVTELTCHIPLTQILSLQPAIEVVTCGSGTNAVGILRLIACL